MIALSPLSCTHYKQAQQVLVWLQLICLTTRTLKAWNHHHFFSLSGPRHDCIICDTDMCKNMFGEKKKVKGQILHFCGVPHVHIMMLDPPFNLCDVI